MSTVTLEDLTSYSQVLAVLGIDTSELPEETFEARGLWDELSIDIATWLPVPDTVDSLIQAAENATDTTSADLKLHWLKMYSRYFCAWLLMQSGDLLLSERISDGQNENQRSRRPAYDALIDRFFGLKEKCKTAILTLYNPEISATRSVATLFSAASPSFDPVMNETT